MCLSVCVSPVKTWQPILHELEKAQVPVLLKPDITVTAETVQSHMYVYECRSQPMHYAVYVGMGKESAHTYTHTH